MRASRVANEKNGGFHNLTCGYGLPVSSDRKRGVGEANLRHRQRESGIVTRCGTEWHLPEHPFASEPFMPNPSPVQRAQAGRVHPCPLPVSDSGLRSGRTDVDVFARPERGHIAIIIGGQGLPGVDEIEGLTGHDGSMGGAGRRGS